MKEIEAFSAIPQPAPLIARATSDQAPLASPNLSTGESSSLSLSRTRAPGHYHHCPTLHPVTTSATIHHEFKMTSTEPKAVTEVAKMDMFEDDDEFKEFDINEDDVGGSVQIRYATQVQKKYWKLILELCYLAIWRMWNVG